ncbi:erythromycin esterase family protein [Photobacterium kasasachensis]|uniref:erythromycin esterase family protein n=1 Tax=Photobacterium kasasachensis TaxID=2910240 RepID=UPI003D0B4613
MKKLSWLLLPLLVGCNSSDSNNNLGVHQLESTNIDYGNSDLTEVVAATKGYDIVGLGEMSHSGSKAFSLRARMIKAMHQESNLDLVAVEAGLYDGLAAWQNYLTKKQTLLDAVTGPDANYMYVHRLSLEMAALFDYVNDVDQLGSDPLILTGYDARINSNPGCSVMFDELAHYLSSNNLHVSDFESIKNLAPKAMCSWLYQNDPYNNQDHTNLLPLLGELQEVIAAQKQLETIPPYNPNQPRPFRQYASFWLQIAKSLKAHVQFIHHDFAYDITDAQSAENLRWLKEEWFKTPGQIVVFAHNMHATPFYGSSVIDATHNKYPDVSTYSVLQLSYTGYLAADTPDTSKWHPEKTAFKHPDDSLEHQLYSFGYPDSFIDLKSPIGNKLKDVPSGIDSILFIPVEEPAVPRW